jgi:hypothetical protein
MKDKEYIDKFNKMMEDKKKLSSPDFEGNIVKVELEESDVNHCEKLTITIENISRSSMWILKELFKKEAEIQEDSIQPFKSLDTDLMKKLSSEIKDKCKV